ncbi:methylated-DNA--[protein]-cysteine S-methyltransferase [Entomoplasma freundtii]|nr:methylated-DNA--[protein]-cysteine S-methyltransferase [Entomoplasma freundtii]
MEILEIIEKSWNADFELKLGFWDNRLVYIGFLNDPWPLALQKLIFVKKKQNFSQTQLDCLSKLDAFINHENYDFAPDFYFHQGTSFEKLVWSELLKLVYGETITYSDLANKIGHPKAVRSVASAVAKNPFLLLVPCHRVISKNGASHYRSGSLKKQFLLNNGY